MADFKDLKDRVVYAVPLAIVAVVCMAFVPSTMVFIAVLACIFTYEVMRSMHRSRPLRREAVWISIAFLVMGCAGFAVAAYLRLQDDGVFSLLLIAFGVVATDTFAYVGGKQYGHTPFFPSVSPNKTREGTLTGLICGTLLLLTGYWLLTITDRTELGEGAAATLVILTVPVVAVAGDLLESKAKRLLNIKDFGTSLGSHGGVADRFDAMLAAFLVYGLIYEVAN